jgi:hypothetical protein
VDQDSSAVSRRQPDQKRFTEAAPHEKLLGMVALRDQRVIGERVLNA